MAGKGLSSLARDLGRRARAALIARNSMLQRRALDYSRDGIVITGPADNDHPILYVNPAFERAYGYPAREILGCNCRFLQAGDTDQPVLEDLRAALREGREFTGVVRNYHRDGRLIYNELSISPVRDRRGRLKNFIGVQNDITARVGAEREQEESERRLRALLAQYGSEMITLLDPDGTPRYESPAVERVLGYRHRETAGEDLMQRIHPDDKEKLAEATRSTLATPGESPPVEYRIRHADGSWRYFESVGNNLADDPEIRGVVVSTRDITARKQAEQARRRSDEYFRAVVQNSSEIVKVVKPDGSMIYASPAFERAFGYSAEQTADMNVLDYVHPEDLPRVGEDTRKALEQLESGDYAEAPTHRTEYRFLCADGSWRCIEGVGTYLLNHPDIEGVVINARDVTDRKRAEAALAESEARYRAVVEDQTELICRFSPELTLTFVNAAYCRYFGKSAEELIGTSFLSFVPPEDHDKVRSHLASVREGDEAVTYEHRVTTLEGEIRWQQWTDRAVIEGGKLVEYQSVGRDITARMEAEEALRGSEEHFRRVVETLTEGLIVTDAEDLVLDANSRMTELTGYTREEMIGRAAYSLLLPPEQQSAMFERNRERLRRGEHENYEQRLRRKDGHWFWAGISAAPYRDAEGEMIGTLGTIADITERKRAEEGRRESEERFRQLFEHSVDALFVHDAQGRIRDVNPEACRSTGYSRRELLSMRVSDLTDDLISDEEIAERERAGGTLWRRIISGDPQTQSAVHVGSHRRKDGSVFPIEVRLGGVDYGGERLILASARDITERERTEQRLVESEERFRQLFEQSVDAIIVLDERGNVVDVNSRACISLGYTREELLSMTVRDYEMRLLSEQERAVRERAGGTLWQRILTEDPGSVTGIHLGEHRRKDGTTFPVEVHVGGVDYGGQRMIFSSIRDITERRELEAQLEHLAFHDELTGLPNRAYFMDCLQRALSRAEKYGSGVAVLFLDIDDFKLVNDSLGHSMGDQLLAAVARRLQGCLRPADVVSRFGGDEFTILLEDTSMAENATLVAERISESLRSPVVLGRDEVFVNVSVGITFSAPGRKAPEALMRDADATMYRAKASGKGHYEVSDPSMSHRAMQRLQLENDLRRAVESHGEQFELHYQPKVSVESAEVLGMEALVRWRLPEGDLVYPDDFIPLAEESGLIVPIGEVVLETACGWLREQQDLGRCVSVSVNLSARQFRQPELVSQIRHTLTETGVAPESLVLEITEGLVLEHAEALEKLRELKSLGVQVELDDFGTGYSSLSYLKHLPVDAVKIDKVFIDGLGNNREDTVLVSAVINLARALGLGVVAEGVQTSIQLEKLREMECPQAQGYLFSRPLPADEAADFIDGGPRTGR